MCANTQFDTPPFQLKNTTISQPSIDVKDHSVKFRKDRLSNENKLQSYKIKVGLIENSIKKPTPKIQNQIK